MKVTVFLHQDDDCGTCIHKEVCGFKQDTNDEMSRIAKVIDDADLQCKMIHTIRLKCSKHQPYVGR